MFCLLHETGFPLPLYDSELGQCLAFWWGGQKWTASFPAGKKASTLQGSWAGAVAATPLNACFKIPPRAAESDLAGEELSISRE